MTTAQPSSGRTVLPGARPVRSPRGTEISCKSWQTEAALRMLMNNLDPEVAEDPDNLIVYGGRGQAARTWADFDAIVDALRGLESDQTLLVQSGRPVGVARTHPGAPRVLIANSNLVPKWATQEHFDELARKGLIMYGQMTAGSWIYIGTQGILQGTYETFAACGHKHFPELADDPRGPLTGKLVVTGGCGGMGGAQPLAVTLNGGTCLIADVDRARLDRRAHDRYLDEVLPSIDQAVDAAFDYAEKHQAVSVGVEAGAADVLRHMLDRELVPDVVTDQTSAHDPLVGYVPAGLTLHEADLLRHEYPADYTARSKETMEDHVRAMVELMDRGAVAFDYGNNIRQHAADRGFDRAFAFPGFVPAYIRDQFCAGRGPFRWAALSGDPADIFATDDALLELFPDDQKLRRWIEACRNPDGSPRFAFQGLPARICWLGLGERDKAGVLFNQMVADGRVRAPIAIGRDHLDCGSVASPNRETEAMPDGSDAVADWPLLNALLNTASGATWVSIHQGGGVGVGYSQHAGQVTVADGTKEAEERLRRVLWNDPWIGVVRHGG